MGAHSVIAYRELLQGNHFHQSKLAKNGFEETSLKGIISIGALIKKDEIIGIRKECITSSGEQDTVFERQQQQQQQAISGSETSWLVSNWGMSQKLTKEGCEKILKYTILPKKIDV